MVKLGNESYVSQKFQTRNELHVSLINFISLNLLETFCDPYGILHSGTKSKAILAFTKKYVRPKVSCRDLRTNQEDLRGGGGALE